jgi:hypothetical protein
MKSFFLFLGSVLLFTCTSLAQTKEPKSVCKGINSSVATLAAKYRRLRKSRSQTTQGSFNRDLDSYGGTLHQVMSSLGEELGRPPHTRRSITSCLDAPDAIRSNEQMFAFLGIYKRELEKAGRKVEKRNNAEYLIYSWRGWHDFLFFICEDGVVVDHGWWFAYE